MKHRRLVRAAGNGAAVPPGRPTLWPRRHLSILMPSPHKALNTTNIGIIIAIRNTTIDTFAVFYQNNKKSGRPRLTRYHRVGYTESLW